MPIYDFKCDTCGHEHEVKMPIARLEKFKTNGYQCQSCKNGMMYQKIGAPAIVDRANLRIPKK
jgi:predicted nucleic acid-binding Zn ribbon protein